MNDFAVFIMVYGRPQKAWTYNLLRKCGYTGKIFLVADNTDESVEEYKKIYGDDLLVFDKKAAHDKMDAGDNTGDLRSTLYAANTIFDLAKQKKIKYFMIMCDDYTDFAYTFEKTSDDTWIFKRSPIHNLDNIFRIMVDFYKKIPALTIAMAQGGDFIGGTKAANAEVKLLRKAMNTFLCSTERPFQFMGRLNEDVTTYINLGSKGSLLLTIASLRIDQQPSQSQEGGLTDVYLDNGTYMKSFFPVMYNPSSVVVSVMGAKDKRIHHKVKWNNAVPKIVRKVSS